MIDPNASNLPEHAGPKSNFVSILGHAVRQYKMFWARLLLVVIVYLAVTYVLQIPSYLNTLNLDMSLRTGYRGSPVIPNLGWYFLYAVVVVLITALLTYGNILASIKAARGEKPSVVDLFRPFKRIATVIFSALLLGIIIGIASLFLVIPGIYLAIRFALVPFLIVDQKIGVFDALHKSWEMTEGNFWKIFSLGLVIMLIAIVLVAIFFVIVTSGGLFNGLVLSASKLLIYQVIFILIMVPFSILIMLIGGSLYYAIQLDTNGNRSNPETVVPPSNSTEPI
jgi:hypothetical protein